METWWAAPAQACVNGPIRADWTFLRGELKRQALKQSINTGATAMDSMRNITGFNTTSCQHVLLET